MPHSLASVQAQLALAAPAAPADKPALFRAAVAALLAPALPAGDLLPALAAVTDALLHDSTGLVVARPLLSELLDLLHAVPAEDDGGHVADTARAQAYKQLIDALEPRIVSFEEQVAVARERLAEIQERDEEWSSAARTLMAIKLDSGHRTVSDADKLRLYIHIVRLLLEDDDTVTADAYLKRASPLIHPQSTDPVTLLSYTLCHARILDAQRDFVRAALKYLELSYAPQIHPDEKLQLLEKAVTCAVLANAGPQRARVLATLYKDERVAKLPSRYAAVLEKMHLSRILRPHEVREFLAGLQGHHVAKLADGTTVFDRAVTQHNLLSASHIYANISFTELGRLLGLSADAAEQLAADMVGERRLAARLDAIGGYVDFENAGVLAAWDARVASMCAKVDDLAGVVAARMQVAAAAQGEAMQVE